MSNTAVSSEASQVDEAISVLYKEEYKPWFWPLVVPVFPLLPLMWKYHVIITEDELSFGYSSVFTAKRVANRHATIKEVTPLFDQKWMGWGIHYSPDPTHSFFGSWERQYICENGGAVKMILYDDIPKADGDEEGNDKKDGVEEDATNTEKTTTFYFSTRDPQKVCDILNKKA